MNEPLRDLERAAQDGLLDPVRVLVELDRRGELSRGRTFPGRQAQASVRFKLWLRSRSIQRTGGRGLGPSLVLEADIARFRLGFVEGWAAGEFWFVVPGSVVSGQAEAECDRWLFGRSITTSHADWERRISELQRAWIAPEPLVYRDINVRRRVGEIRSGDVVGIGSDGYYIPLTDGAGSLIGVAVMDPDRVGDAITASGILEAPRPGQTRGISAFPEAIQALDALVRTHQPVVLPWTAPQGPEDRKAERAREKTRANVRRRPPRRLS